MHACAPQRPKPRCANRPLIAPRELQQQMLRVLATTPVRVSVDPSLRSWRVLLRAVGAPLCKPAHRLYCHNSQVYVPPALRQECTEEMHDTPYSGTQSPGRHHACACMPNCAVPMQAPGAAASPTSACQHATWTCSSCSPSCSPTSHISHCGEATWTGRTAAMQGSSWTCCCSAAQGWSH